MYNTTVANTNFIIQTQILFLAIFGYIFLKEKISKITLISIFLAIAGVILMVGSSLSPGQMTGNLAAFIMPISFAILILVIRKYPHVDMIPLQLVAGIVAMIVGYLIAGKINISYHDKDKNNILPVLQKMSSSYQDYSGRRKKIRYAKSQEFIEEQLKKALPKQIENKF